MIQDNTSLLKNALIVYMKEIEEEQFGGYKDMFRFFHHMKDTYTCKRYLLNKALERFAERNPKTNGLILMEAIHDLKQEIK